MVSANEAADGSRHSNPSFKPQIIFVMHPDNYLPLRPSARLLESRRWALPITTTLLFILMLTTSGCIITGAPSGTDTPWGSVPETLSPSQIIQDLGKRRVLFVGEQHTRYDHHLLQLEALKAMHRQNPQLAIGVEWFQKPFQQHLDDYIAGRIDEKTMLQRSQYFQRWRYDYRLYRPIIQFARQQGIPIIALNAPVELTDAIKAKGLEQLPPVLASQLPDEIDRSNIPYINDLRGIFQQHAGAESRSFERFIDVQLTWDETMAEQAAGYLTQHPHSRMIIFAGVGHVRYGWGIPDRLARRTGLAPAILLASDNSQIAPGVADFVVVSTEKQLPPPGLLGIFIDRGGDTARIQHVIEGGAAAKAGLLTADIILAIDGQPTQSFADIKLALMGHARGDAVQIRYRHEGQDGETSVNEVTATLQ